MTQKQEQVLKNNVEFLEMLMKIHNEKDQTFFDIETKEALLLTICATNAVIKSLNKKIQEELYCDLKDQIQIMNKEEIALEYILNTPINKLFQQVNKYYLSNKIK